MDQIEKVIEEEEEDWGRCFLVETREIDVMVSSNFEGDLVKDSEYNEVDHVEKHDTDIISIKQETSKVVHTSDMVAYIGKIKAEDLEYVVSETIYASGDFYEEIIKGDVLEVEVFDQSAISRSIVGLEQTLEANGKDEDSDPEGQISREETEDMIFRSFEADKLIMEEIKTKFDGGSSYYSVEASQIIEVASSDNATVGKLRERGSPRTHQGDNLHVSERPHENIIKPTRYRDGDFINTYSCFFAGPIDYGKPSSFERTKRSQKKTVEIFTKERFRAPLKFLCDKFGIASKKSF